MFRRILKQVDEHLEEYLLAVLLILISCVMLLQVIMRYVFNAALSWPEEFTRYCFVYTTFITIGLSIRKETMLKVDLVLDFLPKAGKNAVEIIVKMVSLALFLVLFYNSFGLVDKIYMSQQSSPAMKLPMYLLYFSTVIGFGLGSIRSLQNIIQTVKKLYFDGDRIKEETV